MVPLRTVWHDLLFQFSRIVQHGGAFVLSKTPVLMGESDQSLAHSHQFSHFISHVMPPFGPMLCMDRVLLY